MGINEVRLHLYGYKKTGLLLLKFIIAVKVREQFYRTPKMTDLMKKIVDQLKGYGNLFQKSAKFLVFEI